MLSPQSVSMMLVSFMYVEMKPLHGQQAENAEAAMELVTLCPFG